MLLGAGLIVSVPVFAQKTLTQNATVVSGEQKAAKALQTARSNPLSLYAFLYDMPKGGDLHNHLAGAIYAESLIRVAIRGQLCVNRSTMVLRVPNSDATSGAKVDCSEGEVPAATALSDQHLYDSMVDAYSMRGFVPSPGITAHDQFFNTFGRFEAAYDFGFADWLDEVTTRAAAQNEQYLELMHTPAFGKVAAESRRIGWQDDLAQLRTKLLTPAFREDIDQAKVDTNKAEATRNERQHCESGNAAPGCGVQVRYLCQVLRGFPKEQVFAQTLFCFELANADPRYVGINMVMPEDGATSMADYDLQMKMVAFLHSVYPKVHISLHAGELAPGLVPYEGLCCHIRLAVEVAHAERIGHGVDVMYEERPYELLREMSARHVMVEINLTSNEVILGVEGKEHPLPLYRQFGVPVALSTDDEGVSRINLTHEFARAVSTYELQYLDLKNLVRASLEHSFLPGPSLWSVADNFHAVMPQCAHDAPGTEQPSATCRVFLNSSQRAQQQWELERRFRIFETKF